MEVLAAASDRAFLGDGFSVEDLLIEPEGSVDDQGAEDQAAVSSERRDLLRAPPTPSPPAASSGQLPQNPATELGFHAEDGAELEWLSQFVEDSFSESPSYGSENINLPRVQKTDPLSTERRFAVPVGARSKRSRRFPSSRAEPPGAVVVEAEPTKGKKKRGRKRKHQPRSGARCSHCGAGKTPQWRAGPTGAGTLCNACGVRFRSGRLLPEYRPACSPTFVSSVHSNCHRKVLELRRKKERAAGG